MKTKKRNTRQRRTLRRKQRGGIQCNQPTTWTPISYSDNSCWLDTFLLAFLHHPNTAIDTYLQAANENIELMKSIANNSSQLHIIKQHETILNRLLKIRSRLRGVFSEPITGQALAKIRENIRTSLSTCPTGGIFAKGEMSSTAELFEFLSKVFDFPKTIKYAEKQRNSAQIVESVNYISLSGFDIAALDEIVLSNVLTKVQKYPEQRIARQYKRFGDIVPINIERDDFEGGVIQTPIYPEEYINLKTASNTQDIYRLVSIVCNVGAHYVTYLSCDDNDTWIFYNDLLPPKDRIKNIGNLADWWGNEIPGYTNTFPATHATWLLYIKV